MPFTFCVPTLFGLEGLVGEEARRLELPQVQTENGRVFFTGGAEELARANIGLRCGERVLLMVGRFPARTFEELFQGVRNLPWEELLPKDAAFPVKGHSLDSKLFSVPDCQAIIKKAVVERLRRHYRQDWFQETGSRYQIQFALRKDLCEVFLDTSGAGLHKRGYRPVGNDAPLRETLAAGMVLLSRYRGRDLFVDPMCGSGTILIEAALIAQNRAPGAGRRFAAMNWGIVPRGTFARERERLAAKEFHGEYRLLGGDVDPRSVELTRENARRAGVEQYVRVERKDAASQRFEEPRGTLVTNPPYGERLGDKAAAEQALGILGSLQRRLPEWTVGVISPHEEFDRCFGRPADKRRKLYNGMIKCEYYQYLPRRKK